MNFSVVIPTYNRPEPLKKCIESLQALHYDPTEVEILVVDDGGRFPLEQILEEFPGPIAVRFFKQANAGPGAARNTGVGKASGRFIVFVDDDCIATPTLLSDYGTGFAQTPEALLGGRVLTDSRQNLCCQSSQMVIDMVHSFFNKNPEQARFFSSNNFAVPREMFLAIGGFMARTFRLASEDREFCDRWKHQGHGLRSLAGAAIFHEPNLSLYRYTRMYFRYGRGAFVYQRVRSQRGSGTLQEDSGFHVQLVRLMRRFLRRYTLSQKVRIVALLGIWQLANAAGFFYELALDKLQPAQRSTEDAAEVMHHQVAH